MEDLNTSMLCTFAPCGHKTTCVCCASKMKSAKCSSCQRNIRTVITTKDFSPHGEPVVVSLSALKNAREKIDREEAESVETLLIIGDCCSSMNEIVAMFKERYSISNTERQNNFFSSKNDADVSLMDGSIPLRVFAVLAPCSKNCGENCATKEDYKREGIRQFDHSEIEEVSKLNIRTTIICMSGNCDDYNNTEPFCEWLQSFSLTFSPMFDYSQSGRKSDSMLTLVVPNTGLAESNNEEASEIERKLKEKGCGKSKNVATFGGEYGLEFVHNKVVQFIQDENKIENVQRPMFSSQPATSACNSSSSRSSASQESKLRSLAKRTKGFLGGARKSVERSKTMWFSNTGPYDNNRISK